MIPFKTLLYSLAMILFVTLEYYALKKISLWLLYHIDNYQTTISDFWFYVVLCLMGFVLMMALNSVFTFAVELSIRQITKLRPDRAYAVLFTKIYSIFFCAIVIFQTFNVVESGRMVVVFLVMATVLMRAVYVNTLLTKENLYVKQLADDANMSEAA